MLPCPACSHPAESGANFCSRCGLRLGLAPMPLGDRRVVTVLFADVSGFTAMSEQLDPEEVTEIVNQCFAALTEPVYRHGGVVDKYIGDALMALFGAPLAHEDDPERAIAAALAMREAADTFGQDLERRTGIRLRLRIGLNTGLVVAGAVGGDHKRDYTVMGDTVNLAQRMESLAEPGTVLVTQETYRLTAHRFSFRPIGPQRVKGKAHPVEVFELVGLSEARRTPSARGSTVGREREIRTLLDRFDDVREGVPHWVSVTGAAGIGKTRVVEDFLLRLPNEARVIAARGVSYHQDRSLDLLQQVLRSWLALGPHAGQVEARAALDRILLGGQDLPEAPSLLLRLLGYESRTPGLASATEGQIQQAALQVSIEALLADARRQPLVLSIEDLQWADEASMAWLEALAARLAGDPAPVLVVIQARPETRLPELSAPAGLERSLLSIRPFGDREARLLAESMLESSHGSSSALEAALDRAEGNPMILGELIRAFQDGAPLDSSLPSTLKGLVAARLDRLKPLERDVLEWAAVLGRTFEPGVLATVAGLGDPHPVLLSLVEHDLVRPAGDEGFAFAQAIIHEVVYQGMLHRRRRELHRRVVEVLEQRGAGIETRAHVLAHHCMQAGDFERAWCHLWLAAASARAAFAHRDARTALQQAHEILAAHPELATAADRQEVLLHLAEVDAVLGDYPGSLLHLAAAESLGGHPARVLRARGGVLERQGAFAEALDCYEQALRSDPPSELRAALLTDLGWLRLRSGHLEACVSSCEEALGLSLGSPEAARARSILGIALYRSNRWAQARTMHGAALELREQSGDLAGVAASLNNLGMVEVELGAWAEAEGHYMRSLALYRRIGDQGHAASVLNNLGDLCARRNEPRAAERHHREALQIRRLLGDRFGVAASLCALGESLRLRGELEQARACLSEGLAGLLDVSEAELLAEAYEALGWVELSARNYERAEEQFARAHARAVEDRDRLRLAAIARARAQMALELGDLAHARDLLQEAWTQLDGLHAPLELARWWTLESRCRRAEGAFQPAVEASEQARALYRGLGIREGGAVDWPRTGPG